MCAARLTQPCVIEARKKLAMMDHPNIAKVLDAGSIKFGQHHLHHHG